MTAEPNLSGDLDKWTWNPARDDFVRDAVEPPPEILDEIPELRKAGGVSREEVDRLIGPRKFAEALAKATHWYGRTKGLESVVCDENDPAFVEAAEVVYRRLMDGPGRYLLPYVSNRDLVDLLIVSAWAVPYFRGVQAEVKAKRAAAKAQAQRAAADERKEGEANG